MNLGEKIKEMRLSKHMTQDALAMAAGITKTSVSNYERNLRQPQYPVIQAIAHALEVPISKLVETDEKTVNGTPRTRRVETMHTRRMKRLNAIFGELSDEGQIELIKRAEELVYVPAYCNFLSRSIQRYINQKNEANYICSEDVTKQVDYSGEERDYQINLRHIIMEEESNKGISHWHFLYYQFEETAEETAEKTTEKITEKIIGETAEKTTGETTKKTTEKTTVDHIEDSIVEEIVCQYEDYENRLDRYSFVLDNADVYDQFYSVHEHVRGRDDALAELDYLLPIRPEITFFLIDKETWEIKDMSSSDDYTDYPDPDDDPLYGKNGIYSKNDT